MNRLFDLLSTEEVLHLEVVAGGFVGDFYVKSSDFDLCTDHIAIFNLNMELCIDNPDDIREEEDGVMWVNQGVTYSVRTA